MSPRFYLGFLSECQYTFSKKGNFARNLSLSRVIELGIQAVSCISRFNCSFIEFYLTLKTFGIINSSHFEIIIIRDSANEFTCWLNDWTQCCTKGNRRSKRYCVRSRPVFGFERSFCPAAHEAKVKTIKKKFNRSNINSDYACHKCPIKVSLLWLSNNWRAKQWQRKGKQFTQKTKITIIVSKQQFFNLDLCSSRLVGSRVGSWWKMMGLDLKKTRKSFFEPREVYLCS